MKRAVYDTGVLVAADRSERRTWAEHRVRLEAGFIPLVPAPVVARGADVVSGDAEDIQRLLSVVRSRVSITGV